MPIYHHFYIECRTNDGWVVPPGFRAESWTFECDERFGGFAWAGPGAGWLELFGRVNSQFPMHAGPPDDRRGSPLLQYLDQFYDYEANDSALCWMPYSELFIDCWNTDSVTVGREIPAEFALAFGNGENPFPEEKLLDLGLTETELENFRYRRRMEPPIDVTTGRRRYEIAERPPDHLVAVTWRETIAQFVGEPHAHLFQGMRQFGRDDDLRILSRRG
jgi:hypothetical protein